VAGATRTTTTASGLSTLPSTPCSLRGKVAAAHGKAPAQVMLRWGLQQGRSVIPKSTKPSRMAENIDVFEFGLSAAEMAAIDGLETGRRGGPDPEAVTLETFGREIPEA
jgi:diketogulonate reductase-like aldo/keto reductase